MTRASLFYSEALAGFDYGEEHPFKPSRATRTLELCRRYSLLEEPDELRTPVPAAAADLAEFHDPAYLAVLQRAGHGAVDAESLARGVGTDECPARPGLWEWNLLAVGATLAAADEVASGRVDRAFNLVGGFHHAGRGHAEGFCYLHDTALAAQRLAAAGLRVAVVDLDAHHGNGTQDAFYEDPRVLTISLHESGHHLYPFGGFENEIGRGPGRGYNVNLPLAPRTDDVVFRSAFDRVVPPLLHAFAPDLVIAELGADTLFADPLTHLRLTSTGFHAVVRHLCRLAPRLVAVGGGGYDVARTARAWSLAWAALTDRTPLDSYAGLVGGMMYGGGGDDLFDPPIPERPEVRARAQAEADRVVAYLHAELFPLLGASPP